MRLLVDIGNSAIKYAFSDGQTLSGITFVDYHKDINAEFLDRLWGQLNRPDEIWISSVSGYLIEHLVETWINHHWDCLVKFVRSEKQFANLTNAYSDKSQLGVDRWLAMIATSQLIGLPAIIVDCGTAITIDVIDQQGKHLGGFILPGVSSQLQILQKSTEIKAKLDVSNVVFEPAINTKSAIIRGIVYSIVSWIEQVVEDMTANNKVNFRQVITGGEAKILLNCFTKKPENWIFKDQLVLLGLLLVSKNSDKLL